MRVFTNTDDAQAEIEHGCDGPLTPFVLISRAMVLVQQNRCAHSIAANALCNALVERGWLRDDEDAIEVTGS